MVANRPWDNSYNVSDTIWVAAHTTQFTERGWHYVEGGGCALLQNGTGGSHVSLASPDMSELSIVIETVGAAGKQTIDVVLQGAFASSVSSMALWTTSEGAVFQQQPPVSFHGGRATVFVPADSVWTLSTTTGQQKGGGGGNKGVPSAFPTAYTDDFEVRRKVQATQ